MQLTLYRAGAVIIFLSLSCIGAWKVQEISAWKADVLLQALCPQPPTYKHFPQLHYTGLAKLDDKLCYLVTFFNVGLLANNVACTLHFLAGFAPVILVYLLESARVDSMHLQLLFFVAFGNSLLNAGASLPLMWISLAWSSAGRPYATQKPLTRAQAESVSFGVLLGYVLPTLCMALLHNPYLTAYWQIFPAYIWIVQSLWLDRRGSTRNVAGSESGLPIVRAALITAAVISAIPHLHILYRNRSLSAFVQWWSSLREPILRAANYYTAVPYFVQWESIVWYTTSFFAAAFMAESLLEGLTLLFLAPVVSAFIGPGATIAFYWLRREQKLINAKKADLSEDRKMR